MDIGEKVTKGLAKELKSKCPFSEPADGSDEEEDEDILDDDLPAATKQQENNGGVLGRNLVNASQGKKGTVGGPNPAPDQDKAPRFDTKRTRMDPKGRIFAKVLGTDAIRENDFPFTVAAHHLIPGEAALAPSLLKPFMTKNKSVDIQLPKVIKKKKIQKHIGYNVNGAHNGVWLPGNYAIRKRTSPVRGKTWSVLVDTANADWCLNYVAAVTKVGRGQFHDTHTAYSGDVKGILNKIQGILSKHECEDCEKSEINPPFLIKGRLYNLSKHLRTQVVSAPSGWKRPWFTSDKWRDKVFGSDKAARKQFDKAYEKAQAARIKRSR